MERKTKVWSKKAMSLLCCNLVPRLPTMQICDTTGGTWSDYIQLHTLKLSSRLYLWISFVTVCNPWCFLKQTKGLNFAWVQNGKVLTGEKKQTLEVKEDKDLVTATFSCNVSNQVSTQASETKKQTCVKSGKYHPVGSTATCLLSTNCCRIILIRIVRY